MQLKTALRAIMIGLATFTIALPASAFGIGLQPTTIEMSLQPGERQRQVITIGNMNTEESIALSLGLADWSLDMNGQLKLNPPGESETSAAEWVRFSPAFLSLAPGETEQVIVDMSTPIRLDREGDFRFALIASTLLPEERSGQSGVWKKYQIASLFYLTMGNGQSEPIVKAASLSQNTEGEQMIVVDLDNTGNAHARLRGELEITGEQGASIKMPVSNLVILHDAARTFSMPLEAPLPANPKVKLTLENIHAPQSTSGVVALAPFKSDLSIEETELQNGSEDHSETSLE